MPASILEGIERGAVPSSMEFVNVIMFFLSVFIVILFVVAVTQ